LLKTKKTRPWEEEEGENTHPIAEGPWEKKGREITNRPMGEKIGKKNRRIMGKNTISARGTPKGTTTGKVTIGLERETESGGSLRGASQGL